MNEEARYFFILHDFKSLIEEYGVEQVLWDLFKLFDKEQE